MKDKLIDILQERFNGHEANVDPGVWQSISGQLAHTATGAGLRETLQKKFAGHEAHVDPSAWSHISSQLGHGAAGATGIGGGWMAAGIAGIALIGGLLLWSSSSPDPAPKATAPNSGQVVAEVRPATDGMQVQSTEQTAPLTIDQASHGSVVTSVPVESKAADKPASIGGGVPASSNDGTKGQGDGIRSQTTSQQLAEGEQVVQTILQEMVTENMVKTSAFPPPTTNELPDKHIAVEDHPKPTDPGEQPAEPTIVQAPEPNLFIPNVFSPNGDGINDKLEVQGEHYVNGKVLVRIFSAKNSTLVFSTDNLVTSWDGRDMRGALCEEGYYFYAIEVTGEDGQAYSKGETVRLFRN